MLSSYVIFAAALLGLVIGSFLNVVLMRTRTGERVSGRSACMTCGSTLAWYELIPLVSFVVQRGRCRTCGSRIAWQYPLVELATAILFGMTAAKGFSFSAFGGVHTLLLFVVVSFFVLIFAYDLKHNLIPNTFSYGLAGVTLLLLLLKFIFFPGFSIMDVSTHFLAGIILFLPFAFLWYVSRGTWMGLGDAKLALGIGWFLGPSAGAAAIVLSFWGGAIVGLALIGAERLGAHGTDRTSFTLKSELPFGPFMVLGTLFVWWSEVTFMTLSGAFSGVLAALGM